MYITNSTPWGWGGNSGSAPGPFLSVLLFSSSLYYIIFLFCYIIFQHMCIILYYIVYVLYTYIILYMYYIMLYSYFVILYSYSIRFYHILLYYILRLSRALRSRRARPICTSPGVCINK